MSIADIKVGDVIFDSCHNAAFTVERVYDKVIYSRTLGWYCWNYELHPFITEVRRNGEVIFRRQGA